MIHLESISEGTILPVRAHAGAQRNTILGQREGALRVAVSTAPEKGKANQAIVAILSKSLGISKSSIELIGGSTSRHKRFLLAGISLEQTRQKLQQILGDEPG